MASTHSFLRPLIHCAWRCPQLFYRYVPRGGDQLDMAGLAGFLQEFMPDLKRSELNFFKVKCLCGRGLHRLSASRACCRSLSRKPMASKTPVPMATALCFFSSRRPPWI